MWRYLLKAMVISVGRCLVSTFSTSATLGESASQSYHVGASHNLISRSNSFGWHGQAANGTLSPGSHYIERAEKYRRTCSTLASFDRTKKLDERLPRLLSFTLGSTCWIVECITQLNRWIPSFSRIKFLPFGFRFSHRVLIRYNYGPGRDVKRLAVVNRDMIRWPQEHHHPPYSEAK